MPKTKIVGFANSIDPDEAAQYELPHLDLYCLLPIAFLAIQGFKSNMRHPPPT